MLQVSMHEVTVGPSADRPCYGGPWDGVEVRHAGQAFPVAVNAKPGVCNCNGSEPVDGYYVLTPKNDFSRMIWRWSFRLPVGFTRECTP